jgi:hypothetical protein
MYQIGKNIYMGKPQTWKKFAGGTFVINKVRAPAKSENFRHEGKI